MVTVRDIGKFTNGRYYENYYVTVRSRLNSGNACYHAVQNLLSSRLLSRNVKIKI
jgi:hypothetical protein